MYRQRVRKKQNKNSKKNERNGEEKKTDRLETDKKERAVRLARAFSSNCTPTHQSTSLDMHHSST